MFHPGQHNPSKVPTGFTLIELLLVIAIIGVLAALLLSGLSAARLKADQITCLNNTRELAQTTIIYQDDHHDKGLPSRNGGPSWSLSLPWNASGMAVPDTPNVNVCPLARGLPTGIYRPNQGWLTECHGTADQCWVQVGTDDEKIFYNVGSYAANGWFVRAMASSTGIWISPGGSNNAPKNIGFPTVNSVRYPSRTPLFADGKCAVPFPDAAVCGWDMEHCVSGDGRQTVGSVSRSLCDPR